MQCSHDDGVVVSSFLDLFVLLFLVASLSLACMGTLSFPDTAYFRLCISYSYTTAFGFSRFSFCIFSVHTANCTL